MSIQVSIIKGYYRNKEVSGVFPLIRPYQEGARGGFITVHNPKPEPGNPHAQRIRVEPGDYKLLDSSGNELDANVEVVNDVHGNTAATITIDYEKAYIEAETEDEAMTRIAETFLMLDKIVDSSSQGIIRGLVVSGPPGIGKSFGVEKQLDAANMFRVARGEHPLYEVVSGGVSPIGLYQKLYYNRHAKQVLVFDDTDGILFEEESLALLKAALNSGEKRRICWNKESRVLAENDIPDFFDFEGSIIFLSNIDFERTIARGSRIAAHLSAIMSRCHYLDLEIGSLRDKLLRIRQIVRDGMLASYCFTQSEEDEIVKFVYDNSEFLREVSLRTVKKIADFVKTDPNGWRELAEATILTRDAKFKRLMQRREQTKDKNTIILQMS